MERLSDIQKRHLLVQVQRQCLTINLFDIVSLIDKYENLKIEDFAPPVLTEDLYLQLLDLFIDSNENNEWFRLTNMPRNNKEDLISLLHETTTYLSRYCSNHHAHINEAHNLLQELKCQIEMMSEQTPVENTSQRERVHTIHQTYLPKITSSDTDCKTKKRNSNYIDIRYGKCPNCHKTLVLYDGDENCCPVCGCNLVIERSSKQSQENYDVFSPNLLWLLIKIPFVLTSALISQISHGLKNGYRFITNKLNSKEEMGDHVFSSVFAPSEVKRGTHMLIQVYLHTFEETDNIKEYACESCKEVERRDYIPLDCYLKKGDKVKVHLNIYGNRLMMSKKREIVWNGTFTKCSFDYYIQNNTDLNELSCNATLSVNDVQVGEMRFVTQIVDMPLDLNPNINTRKYNKIFISYAHQDEKKVKYIAEAYKAQGINYFFDRHYLKGGDVFPLQIQEYINSADLFVLCWSENSKKSEYVKKEYTQALTLAFPQVTPMEKATLSIYPLSIEPHAELPEDMRDIYNFGNL